MDALTIPPIQRLGTSLMMTINQSINGTFVLTTGQDKGQASSKQQVYLYLVVVVSE